MNLTEKRIVSVLFSMLLVVGAIAPAASAGDRRPAASTGEQYPVSSQRFDNTPVATHLGNETPLEHRIAAAEQLSRLASSTDSTAARIQRAEQLISAHVAVYRNESFVADSAVFHADASALEEVAPVADDHPSAIEQVTSRLATADAESANVSLTAAERANATYGSAVETPARRDAVERHLTNARDAYQQGQSLLDSASGTNAGTVRQRARAVRYFGTAWQESQRALELLDAAVDPNVTIHTRSDMPLNRTNVTRTVAGTVTDVRPAALSRATLRRNGTEQATGEVYAPAAPATNGTFSLNATLQGSVNEITVSVDDPGNQTVSYGDTVTASPDGDLAVTDGRVTDSIDARADAVGPTADFDADSHQELPYIAGGELRLQDLETGADSLLVAESAVDHGLLTTKTRLAATEWNADERAIFYVGDRKQTIYRFAPNRSATPDSVVSPGDGAQAVAGAADIDADGTDELVFVDGSQTLQYVEQDGTITSTGVSIGSNNGIGVGSPVRVNGTESVPVVTGSNNVALVTASGVRERLTSNGPAAKTTVATPDLDADRDPELVFVTQEGSPQVLEPTRSEPTRRPLGDFTVDKAIGVAAVHTGQYADTTQPGDQHDPQTGTATLRLDGDGLPDTYEETVTGTDPLDSDSDSSLTAADENNQGLLDGAKDFDNDSVSTISEWGIGTDPLDNDTDGDGLRDGFEIYYDGLDPLDNDTDGDGTSDAAEDFDDDNLTTLDEQRHHTRPDLNDTDGDNVTDGREVELGTDPTSPDSDGDGIADGRELQLGTDPLSADSDDDGLTDPVELEYDFLDPTNADTDGDGTPDGADDYDGDGLSNGREIGNETLVAVADTDGDTLDDGREAELGTNATVIDTDSDGLLDATELELGTDPTDPDTDDDGVLDGNETFTTATNDSESGVSVSIIGDGNADARTDVRHRPNYHNGTAASAGPTVFVRTRNASAVDGMEATVPIADTDSDPDDLRVYVWNGSRNQSWHPVKTTVDAANGTATATVEPNHYVTVLNQTAWQEAITVDRKDSWDFESDTSVDCIQDCAIDGGTVTVGATSTSATTSGTLSAESTANDSDGGLTAKDPDNETENTTRDEGWKNDSSGNVSIQCAVGPSGDCDIDDDGVNNENDLCPETPGPPSNDGCPEEDDDDDGGEDGTDDGGDTGDGDGSDDGGDGSGGSGPTDSDGDGVPDDEDNCPNTSNPDQTNSDGDPDGDACDPDDDNDDVPDDEDNCPKTPNSAQVDQDNDGVGAVCDSDEKVLHEARWQVDVPEDVENVTLQFEYIASSSSDTSTQISINGEQFANTDFLSDQDSFTTYEKDLERFRGETVDIELNTYEDAKVTIRGLRVYQDSDGDGLRDYRETQQWTNPNGLGIPFTLDPNSADTDGDGLSDGTEVTLKPAPSNAGVLEVREGISNPARADTDRDGLNDLEEREAGADPFEKHSDSDFISDGDEVHDLGTDPTLRDTDGDGLNDYIESEEIEVLINGQRGESVNTSPLRADTDGDGLSDSEELDISGRSRGPRSLISDPEVRDTDLDGLSDYDEQKLGTDPLSTDSDDDGYIDYVDPQPTQENTPPSIRVKSTVHGLVNDTYYEDRFVVTVRDNSEIRSLTIKSVTERDSGRTVTPLDYKESEDDMLVTDSGGESSEYEEQTYIVGAYDSQQSYQRPDYFIVNATDSNGNKMSVKIDPQAKPLDLEEVSLTAYTALTGGVASAGYATQVTGGVAVGMGSAAAAGTASVLLLGGAAAWMEEAEQFDSYNRESAKRAIPLVAPETIGDTNPLDTPEINQEIYLPSGQAFDQDRGYGKENVFRTPGINDRSDVEYVLNHPTVNYESGPYNIIIGDNPNGPGQIGIWLLGSLLVKADNYEPVEDVLGRVVHINKDEDHATRGGERISNSEIKEVLKNPAEIWQGSEHDYYVGQLNDGSWIVLKVYTGLNNIVYVSTTIPKPTEQGVRDYLENDINDLLRNIYPH